MFNNLYKNKLREYVFKVMLYFIGIAVICLLINVMIMNVDLLLYYVTKNLQGTFVLCF